MQAYFYLALVSLAIIVTLVVSIIVSIKYWKRMEQTNPIDSAGGETKDYKSLEKKNSSENINKDNMPTVVSNESNYTNYREAEFGSNVFFPMYSAHTVNESSPSPKYDSASEDISDTVDVIK